MNRGKSDGKTGRTAALRTRPERTSTKSDQRNFAFLGFSEVQLATIRRQGCCVPS
jgi:hypothetical protein